VLLNLQQWIEQHFFGDNVVTLSLKALIMYYAWMFLEYFHLEQENGLEIQYILDEIYQSNIVTFILDL
jgi:hypothetical protein